MADHHLVIIEGHNSSAHDGCVAIYRDSEIINLSAERVDRIKHSSDSQAAYSFLADRGYMEASVRQDFFVREYQRVPAIKHPLAHAAAAYYPSEFTEAVVLVVEGQGYYTDESVLATSIWVGRDNSLEEVEAHVEPAPICKQSLGHFYSAMTYQLGFDFYDQGKTMALAPYGRSDLVTSLATLCSVKDGRVATDWEFIRTIFYEVFGEAFRWEMPPGHEYCVKLYRDRVGQIRRKDMLIERHHMDLAYTAQYLLEEALLSMCSGLYRRFNIPNLCIAGGVGLNVAANSRILNESGFSKVFVQPAAGDDGQAFGKLLYRMHNDFGIPRHAMRHAYLGPAYSEEDVIAAIAEQSNVIDDSSCATTERLTDEVTRRIVEGQVIAWYQGRSEMGPRALGHRSILADPRHTSMRHRLNGSVKSREYFQPFALSILQEHIQDYFLGVEHSPFMLFTGQATELARQEMPAGVHVDGSSRIQTITAEDNGIFFDLLMAFYNRTGVPAIINTSFNASGEPIVETPRQAIRTFLAMPGIDALVIECHIVRRASDLQ